ncbi:MAG: RHS repeat-associated core domain-containing protein, partial [Candidatus Omnitrophica bacterium]|nr:RHS repeat-associated core domain-containing protein [Candidatus Omnitrophota bacterium]
FGSFSRQERYGDDGAAAMYYFTGKPFDDETGLYYYGARYYSPQIGRFITPDTIVQSPGDPQTLNRYSYCGNNPVNRIDPTGHKWSWGNFWKSFAGAVLGVALTIFLGPAGLGLSLAMAGMIGGAAGGALTGGLTGGWKGALMGGAIGAVMGGIGGWGGGIAAAHQMTGQYVSGMLILGGGAAAATDSWDSFAGGLTGGVLGGIGGNAFVKSEQFQNLKAGNGFRSNRDVAIAQYEAKIRAMHDLNVNQKDTAAERVSRPLGRSGNRPGSTTGPRHNVLLSRDLANGEFEMGPDANGMIQTSDTIGDLKSWGTYKTTQESLSLGGRYTDSITVEVNRQGLGDAINLYNQTFAGNFQYSALNHNSNYAVNSVIYGAGGDVPLGGQAVGRAPGFPDAP